MLADAANISKLQAEKEEQFRGDMDTAKNTTEQLRDDIRQIKQDNEETLT